MNQFWSIVSTMTGILFRDIHYDTDFDIIYVQYWTQLLVQTYGIRNLCTIYDPNGELKSW